MESLGQVALEDLDVVDCEGVQQGADFRVREDG